MSSHIPLLLAAAVLVALWAIARVLSPRRRAARAQFRQWAAFHETVAADLRRSIPRAERNPRIQREMIAQARDHLAESEAGAARCRRRARRGWWR